MLERAKQELRKKINDDKLVENLFSSFQKISEEFVAQKPVDLLQNTGLFVESALRIAEHFVLGAHTPLGSKFDIDICIQKLEKASGLDGLRIHLARLSRSIYDFRSRKKSVHLKAVDPQIIDANLIFNISTWIIIEILKESGIKNPEDAIRLLFTRKIPLVQSVGGIFRTTNPKLSGTQRILLLLYSVPDGLSEDQLLESTRQKIKNKDHLKKNLKNMDSNDLIHKLADNRWTLFGQGFGEAEKIIEKFA
ncbi:MAG: hypothetical protein PHF45_01630 [Candidatus Pacebacteria bacterium]|nr:hypothetical protein [Candidatus Paceibacterota bacterium]